MFDRKAGQDGRVSRFVDIRRTLRELEKIYGNGKGKKVRKAVDSIGRQEEEQLGELLARSNGDETQVMLRQLMRGLVESGDEADDGACGVGGIYGGDVGD